MELRAPQRSRRIQQGKKSLDLSGISKREGGDATIAVTGADTACSIKLESQKEIVDTITIRTKDGKTAGELDANATTIEHFNNDGADGKVVDKLKFEGQTSVTGEWKGDSVSSLAELHTAVGGPLASGTAYYGAGGGSFVIMKTDDADGGIFAVKLEGVQLQNGDDIFA